jgi:hypothetical protein
MYRGDENFREDIKALVLTKGKKPEKKKEKETEDDE